MGLVLSRRHWWWDMVCTLFTMDGVSCVAVQVHCRDAADQVRQTQELQARPRDACAHLDHLRRHLVAHSPRHELHRPPQPHPHPLTVTSNSTGCLVLVLEVEESCGTMPRARNDGKSLTAFRQLSRSYIYAVSSGAQM